jgi:hypothetical protein
MGIEYVSVVNVQVAVDVGERATLDVYARCHQEAYSSGRIHFSAISKHLVKVPRHTEVSEGWNDHGGTVAVTKLKKSDPYISGGRCEASLIDLDRENQQTTDNKTTALPSSSPF